MNRYSLREPSLSVYDKDEWYTTVSFYICKRKYRSGAKTWCFHKWQLEKSQIKDCRFDRIGRPLERLPAKVTKTSQNTMICSAASMESTHYRYSQGLIKAASCSLFPGACLVWMLTQFAKKMDLVALVSNAGHKWYFQRTMAWMRNCLPSQTAVSVHSFAYSLQLTDTNLNTDDFPTRA